MRQSDLKGVSWSRRRWLTATAGAGCALAAAPAGSTAARANWRADADAEALSFLIVSDTHYQADKEQPTRLNEASRGVNQRLIETLNALPGQRLPEEIGGGEVGQPRGVIHLGDMVDTGDKQGGVHPSMTDSEWKHFEEDYGLTGTEGKLRYPVYELHGNHDSPRQRNTPIEGIMRRNERRPGLRNISENGLHYSWDWGNIHFVSLGIVVGPNDDDQPISRYDSYQSLPFLVADLEQHVGDSGRPVVLLQHVDLQRYVRPCVGDEAGGSREICCEGMAKIAWCSSNCQRSRGIAKEEWSFCDVAAYYRAIAPYNVAAIFHGHLHARRTDRWDGERIDAAQGIPVFGVKNAGAGGGDRAFFYCQVAAGELVIREYRSRGQEGWHPEQSQTQWSHEYWRVPLAAAPAVPR
jgi:cytolysin (calcineurin-like family phosphatase)